MSPLHLYYLILPYHDTDNIQWCQKLLLNTLPHRIPASWIHRIADNFSRHPFHTSL